MKGDILIEGLELKGCHGATPEEETSEQAFIFDIAATLDITRAASSDELGDTADYAAVIGVISELFELKRYSLLEAMAYDIGAELKSRFAFEKVAVTVRKPDAPISANFASVGVRVEI